MSKLIFTPEKTVNSIGCIGGVAEGMPSEFWPIIPNTNTYQTHLFTLYPEFLPSDLFPKRNHHISVFISIEKHALGGVKDSTSSKYTVHSNSDLQNLNQGYSKALLFEFDENTENNILSSISLPRKYFEIEKNINSASYKEFLENEHLHFEDTGMGLDVSKIFGIPFFEQDIIFPPPKYDFCLQLLEEDIENKLNIFQKGIGYFFYDKNIGKKLKSGDEAGIFFIQNT